MTLQVICFSKSRPLQLHGYLTSLLSHADDVTVKVLVNPVLFEDAYANVAAEFPQVEFVYEHDFCEELAAMIGPAEYTMFGCDDAIITRDVEINLPGDCIGQSLRLGRHITRDMFGQPMKQPEFEDGSWDVGSAEGDWAYPWEVLGTIYRTEWASLMVGHIRANSPSQLEAKGALCWREKTTLRRLSCSPTSSLVVPTVNLVQQEYPNGICGDLELSPSFLRECWYKGLRMDVDRYVGMQPETWRIPNFYLTRV